MSSSQDQQLAVSALYKILKWGILRIRCMACLERHKACFVEADHLHNIPMLLSDFSWQKLRDYLEVDRKSYISQCRPEDYAIIEPEWQTLAALVKKFAKARRVN